MLSFGWQNMYRNFKTFFMNTPCTAQILFVHVLCKSCKRIVTIVANKGGGGPASRLRESKSRGNCLYQNGHELYIHPSVTCQPLDIWISHAQIDTYESLHSKLWLIRSEKTKKATRCFIFIPGRIAFKNSQTRAWTIKQRAMLLLLPTYGCHNVVECLPLLHVAVLVRLSVAILSG